MRDNAGQLWYQAYQSGLFRLDSTQSVFEEDSSYFDQFLTTNRPRSVRYHHYMGAKVAKNGDILLSHERGILRKKGKSFMMLNGPTNCGDFIVFDILEDTSNHRIFAGSSTIFEFDNTGICRQIVKGRDLFKNSFFLDLELGPKGTIWAGGGLQLGYLVDDSIVEFDYDGGGFPIHFDKMNLIWVGGEWSEGLFAVEPSKHQSVQVAPVFLNRALSFIEQIDSTYLLVGAIDGLYVLQLKEFYRTGRVFLTRYDHHNGLVGQECGQNGIFRDETDLFFFVTESAIMRLDGKQLKEDLGYPFDTTQILITSSEEVSTGISIIEQDSNPPAFRFDHNNFRFRFVCADSGTFMLRYILMKSGTPDIVEKEGVSGNGEIMLHSLPKGKYRLTVQPDLNGRKLVLAREIHWEFEVLGPWDFWGWILGLGILLFILLVILTLLLLRQRNTVRLLLGELHHRVLNNLAIVFRLVNVASSRSEFDASRLQNQIKAFIQVHQQLLFQPKKGKIELETYLGELISKLQQTFAFNEDTLQVKVKLDNNLHVKLDTAARIGLILNELITNSIKHAIMTGAADTVLVKVNSWNQDGVIIEVIDNCKDSEVVQRIQDSKSYGWGLIRGLCKQFNGVLELQFDQGLTVRIIFEKL